LKSKAPVAAVKGKLLKAMENLRMQPRKHRYPFLNKGKCCTSRWDRLEVLKRAGRKRKQAFNIIIVSPYAYA